LQKGKIVTGTFVFSILKLVDDQIPGRLTPSLIPLAPEAAEPGQTSKMLQHLFDSRFPYLSYVNTLYVRPNTLTVKGHHQSIRVVVSIKEDDSDVSDGGLEVSAT
jgi:hypothetical protein